VPIRTSKFSAKTIRGNGWPLLPTAKKDDEGQGTCLIFLLTNDDGYDAFGLQEFARAMSVLGDVYVVAPDAGRSCCSHAVTTADELHLFRASERGWKVSGTPSDCIRVALRWLGIRPDWILSGVNEGGNLGVDIHYSGTVAGAREGRLHGIPSMAISQYLRRDMPRDWNRTALRARYAFEHLQSYVLEPEEFWNINLPVDTSDRIELAIEACSPEPAMLHFEYEQIEADAEGQQAIDREQLIYRSNYQTRPRSDRSDVALCFDGSITVTRLHLRSTV